jgi:hypothetical protein
MDNTVVYAMMITAGLLMACLPFGIFMGLGPTLGIDAGDTKILVTYVLAALALSYVTALGANALIQKSNCGAVKDMKRVTANAGIAFGIQTAVLLICVFVPSVRGLITNILPPDLDVAITDSVGYSYFSFWATMFGIAISGMLSAVCKAY